MLEKPHLVKFTFANSMTVTVLKDLKHVDECCCHYFLWVGYFSVKSFFSCPHISDYLTIVKKKRKKRCKGQKGNKVLWLHADCSVCAGTGRLCDLWLSPCNFWRVGHTNQRRQEEALGAPGRWHVLHLWKGVFFPQTMMCFCDPNQPVLLRNPNEIYLWCMNRTKVRPKPTRGSKPQSPSGLNPLSTEAVLFSHWCVTVVCS